MSPRTRRLWIKICGMTTPEAVAAAVAAGADAVGFVFAESTRRLTVAQACRLAAPARGRVCCVAVTRHPEQTQVDEILTRFRPDVLQTDAKDLEQLQLPQTLERLPVLRTWRAGVPLPARLLFEGAVSGAGRTCDWDSAAQAARATQLVLAGGLNPNNITEAVAAVQPYGVDVSSGVEAQPAVKDPEAIKRFVTAARTAHAALQEPT